MLKINSIELTNVCNLKCFHCPNNNSSFYKKGYMTEEIFRQTLQYIEPNTWVNLNGFGDSSLHPHLEKFLSIAKSLNLKTIMNTNAMIVNKEMVKRWIDAGLARLEISIHKQRSLQGFKDAYEVITEGNYETELVGNILRCYMDTFQEWINNVQVTTEALKIIRVTNVHNFALENKEWNPEELKEIKTNCNFLQFNECVIKWDGTVASCCFDSEATNRIGHISEFPDLIHKPDNYELCKTCSYSWVNSKMAFGEELNVVS